MKEIKADLLKKRQPIGKGVLQKNPDQEANLIINETAGTR